MERPRDDDFEDDEHEEHDNLQLESSGVQKALAVPMLLGILVVALVLGTVPFIFILTMILKLVAPDTR